MKINIKDRSHYPLSTRVLMDLYNAKELPNVTAIQIEPVYGYVGRILYRNGSVRFFRGSGMGVNRLGASEVAKDKDYTKYFLNLLGYKTPPGKLFLFSDFIKKIDNNLGRFGFSDYAHIQEIFNYVEHTFGYPCYAKPNDGSQGRSITCCRSKTELLSTIEQFQIQGESKILIEKSIPYPDYRVVVMGHEIISCYLRKPLEIIGDGISSVNDLLQEKQLTYENQGRDTIIDIHDHRIDARLQLYGFNRFTILKKGESWIVYDISNLSAGGESIDFTDKIHPYWCNLCINIASDMGLRLCGIDLACQNILTGEADYCIFEINAAPGLDNYASSGELQAERVRSLYKRIFNEYADN